MGRSSGLGKMISGVAGGGTLKGKGGYGAVPLPGIPFKSNPSPVDFIGKPTENKGIMSGPIRKKESIKRDIRGTSPDVQLGRVTQPDGSTLITYGSSPRRKERRGAIGRRMPPRVRPLTGGYDPKSGVRYTDRGVPTAVEQTRRVPVQDPTLGGPPEREVPIPKERRQRITRESDPRGGAPFSPDERAMARDRFFETMFERADERKQQKSMEQAERDNVGDALRSERELRESEMARPGDERFVSTEEKERRQMRRQKQEFDEFKRTGRRNRRRGGGMRRRRGRRRDFTRRFSRAEGGRRGRSGREMAEFRDRYVSTLR